MATSSSSDMVARTSTARQNIARQDVSTDNLLSYYSSPLADNPASSPIPISRKPSVDSTSDCSNLSYKSDSTPSDYSNKEEPTTIASSSTSVTRRPSRSSKGATDRRRLAIVQVLNSSSQSTGSTAATSSSSGSIDSRSRTSDMALVAPPDAAPASYMTEGSLKSTSPVSPYSSSLQSYTVRPKHETSPALPKQRHRSQGHQRSASEISNAKRDIAIIGTLTPAHSASRPTMYVPSLDNIPLKTSNRPVLVSGDGTQASENALHPPPLFLHPQSRSPSPVCSVNSFSGNSDFVTTPDIGEGKRIDMPVASPIVVLTSTDVVSPSITTSFLSSHTTNSTAPSRNPADPTPASPHSSYTASSNSTALTTASTIIPRSALTSQKQKPPPSIVVVPQTPNTPKSPTFVSLNSPTPSTKTASAVRTATSSSFSLDNLSTFRNYQPGIHSTAGPLPPPPRASFMFGPTAAPPPRPPRQVRSPSPTKSPTIASSSSPTKGAPSASTSRSGDRGRSPRSQTKEVMMEALKLPPEVTAALSSRLAPVTKAKSNGSLGRTPSGADETSLNNRSDDDNNSNLAPTSTSTEPPPEIASVHTREGAFAPSHIVSPATTTTSSTTTPTLSRTSDMTVQVYPTTTLHTLPERIKVASSSSYEEYTLREEDEGSDYDTCEQKDARHHEQENVDISQPVIKPPPRGQSLAVFNATGIGGLPASSAEDDEWILADTFGGGGGGGGGAKKSLEVEGMPTTPKTLRREKAPKRHSFESHASSNESEGPSPPPKTFRTSFTKGLKRLSLNASPRRSASVSSGHSRTPSQNSSTLPALPDEANHDGRRSFSPSPSPQFDPRPLSPLNPNATSPPSNPPSKDPSPNPYASYNTRPHPLTHKRIKNSSPDALFCSELYSVPKKSTTSAERCAIYARKLNELYLYDCGLGDWVASVSIGISRGPAAHDVSMISFTDTPRKTSHGSTISEATFPRRPDASTATDLMIPTMISSSSSMSPVSSAPRLPYPSLAIKSTSNEKGGLLGHLATPTSSRGTGGFFASLGRKASINRHRGGSSDSGHGGGKARLTKPPPHSASINGNTISSPVLVDTSQSIPGGPRALPGRAKTLMLSPSPSSSKGFDAGSGSESGSGTVGRRPSMYNLSSSSVSDSSHRLAGSERRDKEREDDPAFASQVNRLADLLPHVEKTVLAGYLRRAGQDILAIGQYLDDEKNGCVRRE